MHFQLFVRCSTLLGAAAAAALISALPARAQPPRPVAALAVLLREGLARIKAAGAEVILIDPQYAPRVLVKPHVDDMLALIATAAKSESVGHFHRFELMRHWYEDEHLPFATFVSADGLHMNDWSYACLAKGI